MSIISIPSDVITSIQTAFDDIFTISAKPCQVVYPGVPTSCSNCQIDPIGQKPGFTYRHGGVIPFPNGTACPLCTGTGYSAVNATASISLLIGWHPRDINLELDGVTLPFGVIKVQGYFTDLPVLMNAEFIIIQLPIQGYIEGRYRRFREPFDQNNLIKNRFFTTYLKRVG